MARRAAVLSDVGASAAQASGEARISRLNNPRNLQFGVVDGFMIWGDRMLSLGEMDKK